MPTSIWKRSGQNREVKVYCRQKSTGVGIFLALALCRPGGAFIGSAQAQEMSPQVAQTSNKVAVVSEKRLYLQSSSEGREAWRKLNADPRVLHLLAWYAEKGSIARGDFFFDRRQAADAYLIPLNDSPLLDVQSTSISSASVAHALEGEAAYLYLLRPKSQPDAFLWVTMRSSIQNNARVFRLEVGPELLEYNSVSEKLSRGRLSEGDLISPDFDISQVGTVWNCLLAYLGLSSVSDLFSLISDYCNLQSSVQAVAQMVNGCVNPLNAINCALGVGAFLGCAIGNVGTCVNGSSSFTLSSVPTSRIITQGQSTTYAITAAFAGGFSGPVNGFTIAGLPSGVTYSFTPTSIQTSGGTTTLTVTTASSAQIIDAVLTVSAVGPNGLQNSIPLELNINPSQSGSGTSATFSNAVVSKTNPGGQCSRPPSAQSFLTTDGSAYLYFEATTTVSDNISSDWLAPDNTIVGGGNWSGNVGSYCYPFISLNISNLPSSQLGGWKARVYDNGVPQLSIPFSVSAPSSGPAPPPRITSVTPIIAPVGVNTTFTINGSGFQQGFSGALWVGSNSFPLNPGAQTIWLGNPNQVQLIVQVGALASPTTQFGLQIINPDQQASAIYTGLTAQAGGSGAAGPNVQISFSPNPVPRSTDGSWHYTVIVTETNGVGVTLNSLSFAGNDYSQYIAAWFGTNQIPAHGQISSGISTSGSSGNWPWTFGGSGQIWSQNVTLQP
jgi:hypothetical protein